MQLTAGEIRTHLHFTANLRSVRPKLPGKYSGTWLDLHRERIEMDRRTFVTGSGAWLALFPKSQRS
jgi:hypothetical protein